MSSQFSLGEIPSIILAWIVLSVGITYGSIARFSRGVPGSLEFVIAGFIATATAFIIHEMGHRYVAIRYGYVARFRLWAWGLAMTLVIVFATGGGIVFGAPGAVYIAPAVMSFYDSNYRKTDPERDNMIISAAGPGINLAFAIVFLTLIFVIPSGFLSTISQFGFSLNIGLGSFNMLPVPPLDGSKIFRKNIPIGLAIALPLWAMLLIFVLNL